MKDKMVMLPYIQQLTHYSWNNASKNYCLLLNNGGPTMKREVSYHEISLFTN